MIFKGEKDSLLDEILALKLALREKELLIAAKDEELEASIKTIGKLQDDLTKISGDPKSLTNWQDSLLIEVSR